MVGPVPGSAPNKVPINVPRTIGMNACFSSPKLGRMSRNRTLTLWLTTSSLFTLVRKSATPNKPMASATSSIRSDNCSKPNVKRRAPLLTSVPTTPSSNPNVVIAMPLAGEPRDIVAPASRPSSMIEKISVGPNLKAICTRRAEAKIITMMPTEARTTMRSS